MTTDFLFNLVCSTLRLTGLICIFQTRNERDNWTSRKEFSLTALMFCLSLSSLWRFPKELLVNESGNKIISIERLIAKIFQVVFFGCTFY